VRIVDFVFINENWSIKTKYVEKRIVVEAVDRCDTATRKL